jgi:hypothetical protein
MINPPPRRTTPASGGCALLALLALLAAPLAGAIEPIPSQPGFSGFVLPTVGYLDLRSNSVAGNSFIEVSRDTIDSIFERPGSESDLYGALAGELRYTFEGGRTQLYIGTSLEDLLTLDLAQSFGVRHDVGSAGIVEAGVLYSGIPSEVWEDPYVEGEPRVETDRNVAGLRVRWDRIAGTGLEVDVAWRDIDIDTERSGEWLDLPEAERDLLRRDADRLTLGVQWRARPAPQVVLSPEVRYSSQDAEGAAKSFDAWTLQLSGAWLSQPLSIVGNLAWSTQNYDAVNPIYGRRQNSEGFLVNVTGLYRLPVASGRWAAVLAVSYGEETSDIDFHDAEVFAVTVGVQYRFGALARQAPGN